MGECAGVACAAEEKCWAGLGFGFTRRFAVNLGNKMHGIESTLYHMDFLVTVSLQRIYSARRSALVSIAVPQMHVAFALHPAHRS